MIGTLLSPVRRCGRTFFKDERGGVASLMAVGIVMLVGFIGLSVDAVRGYLVQSRLSTALDAAGLAGARVMFSPDRDADIQMFFDANFPSGFLGATLTGPTFSIDTQQEVLSLTATATIQTSFMRVLGFETMTVAARSEITRQTELLEIVLAVDMSGSMNTDDVELDGVEMRRIEAARAAALEMVDILFGADETKPLLKIGIVPWNGKVNVWRAGEAYNPASTLTLPTATFVNPITSLPQDVLYQANNSPVPLLSSPPNDWKGCVFTRYTDDGTDNDADLSLGPTDVNGANWPAWEVVGPEGEPVPGFGRCTMSPSWWADCTSCLSIGITPLTSTKTEIVNAIRNFGPPSTDESGNPIGSTEGTPTGSTNAPQGLGWAWRVLTPGEPFDQAELDPPGRRTQAIILLTDGEITGAYGDGYKTVFGYSTAAQGTTPPNNSDPRLNKRLYDLATAIKSEGVLIYTIQFALEDTAVADLMKKVASDPDERFYYNAPDADTLSQIFREVANDLSQLRVSM